MSRFVFALLVACNGKDPSSDDGDGPVDADQDGFSVEEDCDDAAASVHPGATEIPYDGIDQDCVEGDPVDLDLDGYDALEAGGDDCDDLDAGIHPDVEEVPYDGIDQDCSGDDLVDVDRDGSGSSDCDDADPEIYPGATEIWYDGIDQDCASDCDYDADGDHAIPVEWHDTVTDGSACDLAPGPEIGIRSDCDDARPQVNTQQIESIDPPDGATGVDAMTPVQVWLRDNELTATLRLLDPSGAEVPAFAYPINPSAFLLYSYDPVTGAIPYPLHGFTTYTVEVQHSCGVETRTFTTGQGLGPVEPTELVGTTWALAPGGGYSWYSWAVVDYFGFENAGLLGVEASDGTTIDLLVAAPDANGDQDLCVPTGEIDGVDFSANPSFTAGPFDYPVTFVAGAGLLTFPHQEGTLQTTIFLDGLIGVILSGAVETEAVATAAGVLPTEPCDSWGCVACPDGSGSTCIVEEIFLFGTMQQTGVPLVPRTAAEIAVDPGCP